MSGLGPGRVKTTGSDRQQVEACARWPGSGKVQSATTPRSMKADFKLQTEACDDVGVSSVRILSTLARLHSLTRFSAGEAARGQRAWLEPTGLTESIRRITPRACAPCANCPSCQSVASSRACAGHRLLWMGLSSILWSGAGFVHRRTADIRPNADVRPPVVGQALRERGDLGGWVHTAKPGTTYPSQVIACIKLRSNSARS